MRSALERTLFAPVAAVRPYLVLKLTLFVLAFDLWLTRAEHGGRYGAGGFNVAHFAWLDAVQPDVSPGLYVGLCFFTGALVFTLGVASRPPRWVFAAALLVYTWSWAMSMLDSYQHHYLLSLVLLALTFFPRLTAEDALTPPSRRSATKKSSAGAKKSSAEASASSGKGARGKSKKKRKRKRAEAAEVAKDEPAKLGDPPPMTSAWAYALLAGSIAVVYAYTAYAKADPEWLSGAALRRVLRLPADGLAPAGRDPVSPVRGIATLFGIEGETFWWMMGHSVVLVQIICAAGYLLSPLRDVAESRLVRAFSWVAMFTALAFHLGAEHMNLKIGWFSWYMVAYALIFFLPARWLAVAGRVTIPLTGAKQGPEAVALRVGLAVVVILAGTTAGSWTEMRIFDVPLSSIFGEGFSWPLVVLGGALLLLTPVRLLARAVLGEPTQKPREGGADSKQTLPLIAAGAGAALLVIVGYAVDLPGAPAAGIVGAVALGAGVVALLVQGDSPRRIHAYGVGAAVAALALLGSVALSDVRWDFYRNVGGDHRRRGEHRTAYLAYVKANQYAPEGEDRQEREEEMRRILERRGELPEAP